MGRRRPAPPPGPGLGGLRIRRRPRRHLDLSLHGPDGRGTALGFEAVEGLLEGRTGGFVLCHEASFTATGVDVSFTIVPGSGTGDLADISGSGTVTAEHGSQESAWSLTYDLP